MSYASIEAAQNWDVSERPLIVVSQVVPREKHAISRRETGSLRKRLQGIGEQPDGSSHQEILGCELNRRDNYEKYKFSVNHCENHMKSDLDTISLKINNRDSKEVKFLIDTGAEISLIKEASLNSEASYKLREGAKIKGIVMPF